MSEQCLWPQARVLSSSIILTKDRFLPETLRSMVGNGSVQVSGIHRALVPVVGRKKQDKPALDSTRKRESINPFVILSYPDVVVTLVFTGIVYAVNYSITATISSSFAQVYPWLSETILGICYLPSGLGMIVGSTFTGKLLDREYAKVKARVAEGEDEDENFPVEYARLRTMPLHLLILVAAVIAWGWSIDKAVHMAVPLVLQVVCRSTGSA